MVGENFPMWFSQETCHFGPAKDSKYSGWWISLSTLENRHTVSIPLMPTPYLTDANKLSLSVMVQKREGRWAFQFTEGVPNDEPVVLGDNGKPKRRHRLKQEDEKPPGDGTSGLIGVDVGLNVIAATSDGRLYGVDFKPKFDKLYKKVNDLRANRQRQNLKKDSKRLHRMERRLTGMVKTATGEVANDLVRRFPNYTLGMEDLDLRGCRGQKRFAYRALYDNVSRKMIVKDNNPAYTSQPCPSCRYVDRGNRRGTRFECLGCGKKAHADFVGSNGLLGRSEDKQINQSTRVWEVGALLRERYRHRRDSSSGSLKKQTSLIPQGRKPTTGESVATNLA